MPELPEVQNFVNSIQQNYSGKILKKIEFHRDNLRYDFDKISLSKIFADKTKFLKCERVGKRLLFKTEAGTVKISLGMSGAFKINEKKSKEIHEHVTLSFYDAPTLSYVDPRRFGFWEISENENDFAANPLNEIELKNLFLSNLIHSSTKNVKQLLLDQNLIGGIGNIYALEALFQANIHPEKHCNKVTKIQWDKLAKVIPKILNTAIVLGGSSISTYRNSSGDKGSFQTLHQVYGREGKACLKEKCSGVIQRIVQQSRSSWFCSKCQKI